MGRLRCPESEIVQNLIGRIRRIAKRPETADYAFPNPPDASLSRWGFFFVTHVTVNPTATRHTRSRSMAHQGGQIVIFVLAGAAECPFAFTYLYARKWFRVSWWIAIAMTIAGFFA